MSRFTLTFGTDNAAFRRDDESLDISALCQVLTDTAQRLDGYGATRGLHEFLIRDDNGNQIGSAFIQED